MGSIILDPWEHGDITPKHIKSEWYLYKEEQCTTQLETFTSTEYLTVWFPKTQIPYDTVYYVKVTYTFDTNENNGNQTLENGPFPILPNVDNEELPMKPVVNIDAPYVYLDIDDFKDVTQNEVMLYTGKLRTNKDTHIASNWVLKTGTGRVIWRSMNDTTNLTRYKLSKDEFDINGVNSVVLEVSHVTTVGYTSPYGRYRMNLNITNFEITSNIKSVTAYQDLIVTYDVNNVGNTYPLSKIEIYHNGELIRTVQPLVENNKSFKIKKEQLLDSTTYECFVHFKSEDDIGIDIKPVRFVITTIDYRDIRPIDVGYKYFETFVNTTIKAGIKLSATNSEQMPDNGILVPVVNNSNETTINIYKLDIASKSFIKTALPFDFINKDIIRVGGVVAIMLDMRRLFVYGKYTQTQGNGDTKYIANYSIYEYYDRRVLVSVDKSDELITDITANNAPNITYVNNIGKIVYLYDKTNKTVGMRMLDVKTGSVIELSTRSDLETSDAVLVWLGDDKILSLGGCASCNQVWLYDVKTNIWKTVTYIPNKFVGLNMSGILRRDGMVVIFNNGDGTNDTLVFDHSVNTIRVSANHVSDDIVLDSTIRLRSGKFIRYNSTDDNATVWIYS